MLKRFYPKLYLDSIFKIDYNMLYKKGFRNLIFDIDNTLVPHDVKEPTERIIKLFSQLKELGFSVCLLSNNNKARVEGFNIGIGVPYVYSAKKPWAAGLKKALCLLGGNFENTALIGDQVFTDVWCGNRFGIYTILVKPVSERDEFTVRLKRGVERVVVNSYLRKSKGVKTFGAK